MNVQGRIPKNKEKIIVTGLIDEQTNDDLIKYQAVLGGKLKRPVTKPRAVNELIKLGLKISLPTVKIKKD